MSGKLNGKGGSGSGLFLMEMIVVVFFFVLCASQCILAFATSERMSRPGRNLNPAVTMAESIVEVWKAEGVDGLTGRLKFEKREENGAIAYEAALDENWRPVGSVQPAPGQDGAAPHRARLQLQEEDGIVTAVVVMENSPNGVPVAYKGEAAQMLPDSGGSVVYVLEAKKYERP